MLNLYKLIRPFVFLLKPELAHNLSLSIVKSGLLANRQKKQNFDSLKTTAFGLEFNSPVGLAAGYDKDAKAPKQLLDMGFGFVEVGTLTPKPQAGNPQPRLFRLAKDKAVINRMGFNNGGQELATSRLSVQTFDEKSIIGINIGANKDSDNKTQDYVDGVKAMAHLASYLVVNISSPNTPGLRDLQTGKSLKELLDAVMPVLNKQQNPPPLLVKVAPDLDSSAIKDISEIIIAAKVDGLIVSNTTIARPETLTDTQQNETGGLSGAPLFEPSTEVLREFYKQLKGNVPIIGVGGISSAEEAYAKIKAGAALVQIYSALIYEGPRLIPDIITGLAELLAKDGYSNISQAVGSGVKNN